MRRVQKTTKTPPRTNIPNHLDLDSIRWLEDFLIDYTGVLVVISHDRRFLNAVCDQIADIDYQTIITYPGNYDDMVRQKAQIRGRQEKDMVQERQRSWSACPVEC